MAIQAITSFTQVKNHAQSTLASNITNVATTFSVAAGEGSRFPTPGNGFYAWIWDADTSPDPFGDADREVVFVSAISTDSFTVTRAQKSTSGVAHNSGEAIRLMTDADLIQQMQDAINFLESAAGNSGFRIFEDFIASINTSSAMGWIGNAAFDITNTNLDANHPGILKIPDGTVIYLGKPSSSLRSLVLGGGTWVLEALILIDTLSTGGEEFDVRFGLGTSSSSEPADGVFFEYDRNSAVGTKWAICAKNGGTATRTDSTVTVVAGSWIKLRIEINAAGSSATFYVNGTSCGTVSTNMPTVSLVPFFHQLKSAGATDRPIYVDYLDVQHRLTTAR